MTTCPVCDQGEVDQITARRHESCTPGDHAQWLYSETQRLQGALEVSVKVQMAEEDRLMAALGRVHEYLNHECDIDDGFCPRCFAEETLGVESTAGDFT